MSTATATERIACAFCKGKGVDPFNIMSPLSTCGGCGGTGLRDVPTDHVRCAYCQGEGSMKTFRCPACDGTGVLAALEPPTRACPDCEGLSYSRPSGLVCLTCRGHGKVHADGGTSPPSRGH